MRGVVKPLFYFYICLNYKQMVGLGSIIFLLLIIHLFFSLFCVFSTLDFEIKWYEKIFLFIPFFNVPYCLFNLQFKNNCLRVENLHMSSQIQILIRRLTYTAHLEDEIKPKEDKILKPFKFLDDKSEDN